MVDIAFSIMGNIMLEDLPKKQVRERRKWREEFECTKYDSLQMRDPAHQGIPQIASLCESLMSSEESVLCRCCREIRSRYILHSLWYIRDLGF